MPRLFLECFTSVSVKDFQNVLRLQRVITLRHSIGFQCNLVQDKITLSSTSCSQKIYDLLLSFLHNYGFSKRMAFCKLHVGYWAVNLESFGLDTLSNTETSKPCIILKHCLVVHKLDILLS